MTLQTGTILNNRYRIVKSLGQGGFGTVYRVWDINLQRAYALKDNIETTEDAKRQFFREAQLLSGLTHTNLTRVIDHFEISGQGQYLVMDFVEGEDLQSKLDQQSPLPEKQVLGWIDQVCGALEYLHTQSPPIIHRDIKPANIRITPQGKAVLVDFGIAKVHAAGQLTATGARAVTPGYSPPEQYVGGGTTPRSDIYALGATLYTLLTGRQLPESISRIVSAQSGGSAPVVVIPPRSVNPGISMPTNRAIMKAIEPEQGRRFVSVLAFRQALSGAGQPLQVTPQAPPQVIAPQPSRHPQPAPYGVRSQIPPQVQVPFRWGSVLIGTAILGLLGILGAASPIFFLGSEGPLGLVISTGVLVFGGLGAALGAFIGQRVRLADPVFLPRLLVSTGMALVFGLALNLGFSLETFQNGPDFMSSGLVFGGSFIGAVLGTWITGAKWFRTVI